MANDPEQWTQADAVKLRTYVSSHPKFLRYLIRSRPKIEGTTMEARAVTGSDANGFFAAVEAIESMQRDPAEAIDDPHFLPSGDESSDQN